MCCNIHHVSILKNVPNSLPKVKHTAQSHVIVILLVEQFATGKSGKHLRTAWLRASQRFSIRLRSREYINHSIMLSPHSAGSCH